MAMTGDAEVSGGAMTIEIGADVVLRIPGFVAVERAAALVQSLRVAASS